MTWRILRHALSMLWRNLGAALVLSIGSVVIYIALGWVLTRLIAPALPILAGGIPWLFVVVSTFLSGTLSAALLTQIGVAWHRRLLLGEPTGLLTTVRRPEGLRYFGWSFVLLLCIALAVSVLLPLIRSTFGLLLAPLLEPLGYFAGSILFLTLPCALVFWLLLRLGLVLPGAAIGSRLSPAQSWAATAPVARSLLGPAVLLALAPAFVWTVPWFAILVGIGIKGLIAPIIMTAMALWLGLSILTTLYGHLVERGPL